MNDPSHEGWFYWDDASSTTYWVWMSEWEDKCAYCDNEWFWEDCSWMYWRHPCDWEYDTDCGWVYWDDWNEEEFWVTCDDFESWDECKYCDNEWIWEDCS